MRISLSATASDVTDDNLVEKRNTVGKLRTSFDSVCVWEGED